MLRFYVCLFALLAIVAGAVLPEPADASTHGRRQIGLAVVSAPAAPGAYGGHAVTMVAAAFGVRA